MNLQKLHIIVAFGVLELAGCTMNKRIYTAGYHVEWNGKKIIPQKTVLAEQLNQEDAKSKREITQPTNEIRTPLDIEKHQLKNEVTYSRTPSITKSNQIASSKFKPINRSLVSTVVQEHSEKFKSNSKLKRGEENLFFNKKTNELSSDFWESVRDFLGITLGFILIFGLVFLETWGLVALFPAMSYWLAVPLAIVILFVLFILLYIWLMRNSVC